MIHLAHVSDMQEIFVRFCSPKQDHFFHENLDSRPWYAPTNAKSNSCTHACIHIHMYTHTCTHICTHACTQMHTCAHTHTHSHTHTHTHACTHTQSTKQTCHITQLFLVQGLPLLKETPCQCEGAVFLPWWHSWHQWWTEGRPQGVAFCSCPTTHRECCMTSAAAGWWRQTGWSPTRSPLSPYDPQMLCCNRRAVYWLLLKPQILCSNHRAVDWLLSGPQWLCCKHRVVYC